MASTSFLRLLLVVCLSYSTLAYVAPFLAGRKSPSRACSFGLKSLAVLGDPNGSVEAAPAAEEAEAVAEAVEEAEPVAAEAEETAEASTDDDAEEEKPKISIKRDRHTIFVGNLPFDSTDVELKDLFSGVGTVELVSIPKNRDNGKSRGFAFVDMSTPEEVEAAVDALDGTQFGGRTLRVNKSLPKDEAKKQPKKSDVGMKKLYVGNLPFDATREDLLEYFGEYGEVADIYIPFDPNSGSSRGFAFLSMDEAKADQAIEETNGVQFMGRRLAVSVPLPPGQKAERKQRIPRTKLYVGNLSFYTTPDTVRALFEEFGEVFDCYLPEDNQTGGTRGFGFVTMNPDGAQAAIDEADGCELDGRIIRVNEAQPKTFRPRDAVEEDDGDDEDTEYDSDDYDTY